MKVLFRKAVSLLLLLAMTASFVVAPPAKVNGAAAPGQEIEVTLAADTASNNLDLTGFSDLLKNRLNTVYGVSLDKIHINAVETSAVSSGFSWNRYDHTNNSGLASSTVTSQVYYYNEPYSNLRHDYHINISGNTIDFYGYGSPAYKDFLFAPNTNANNKVFKFTLDEAATSYHSGEGAGFLFNAKLTNGKLSGYLVLITGTETGGDTEYVTLYKLDDVDVGPFISETSSALDQVAAVANATGNTKVAKWGGYVALLKKVAKTTPSSGTKRYLKLAASAEKVSFYQFTDNTYATIKDKWIDDFSLPATFNSFGFGPIAGYRFHSCSQDTRFTFSDLGMSEDTSVTFTDLVKNTTWNYPGSFRVIANVDNDGVPDFGVNSDLATILYYMMQNSTHYVGWGVNNTLSPAIGGYTKVKDQSDGFVARNNGKGTFISRSDENYDTLTEGTNALADYIADQMGLVPVIAKPVINTQYDSGFLTNGSVTCLTPTVTTSLGNSVGAYQWRTMDVNTGTWQNAGTSTSTSLTFPVNTYSIVSLRVQDSVTAQWSDFAVAYIANDTNAPSVSMFSLDRTELMPDTSVTSLQTPQSVVATDASYHPAGEALTDWEWKVYNATLVEQADMAKAYNSSNKPSPISFNFTGKPAGKYTIKLRVKKGSGSWSAYYSQTVNLFKESSSITINRTSPSGSGNVSYTASQNFSFDIASSGGALASYRIIKIPVGSGSNVIGDWTAISGQSASGSSTVSGGSFEVYVQAKDVDGNSKTQSLGVFSSASVPEISGTALVGSAGSTTATVSANVYAENGAAVTARGIQYWSVTDSVYTAVNAGTGGTGIFSVNLTGLSPNTSYIARGFATNSFGTAYDNPGAAFTTSGNSATTLSQDADALSITYADGDSQNHVTRALYLPPKGQSGNTTVTWSSGNTNLITATGRVTRPEPEGADTYVTLTATLTDNATGAQLIRTFTVKVLKLNDQDAAEDAAKNLTMARAFQFDPGDKWECITKQFLAVTTGDHGTTIRWTSDSDLIKLQNGASGMDAVVTRSSVNNMNVILTAEIIKGSAKVTKTFLLLVVKQGVSKSAESTRQVTTRTVTTTTPSNPVPQTFTIMRTVLENQTKIDTVILDSAKIQALTDVIDPQSGDVSRNTAKIVMNQDATNKADELAIEIPGTSVGALADRNAALEINTDEGSVRIEQSVLKQMSQKGTDLYFRIVPVNDTVEQNQAKEVAGSDSAVAQIVGNDLLNVLGIPRKIETNYSSFDTYVILPFTGITIPTTGRQAFLDSLKIFVEHSDSIGGTELLTPTRIVYQNGEPTGVEFRINRFSRFQIVRVSTATTNSGGGGGATITPALSVTTGSLPTGTAGASYSARLAVAGGTTPYSWTATGLPAGLSMGSDGTITGTPTAAGTYSVVVTVHDNAGKSTTANFTLTVTPAAQGGEHKKYVVGYPDGNFKPNRGVSRAEIATMLYRVLQLPEPDKINPRYSDITNTYWGAKAIEAVTKKEIMTGYPDGTFCPDQPITREEMACVVAKVKHLQLNGEGTFTDTQASWAKGAIGAVKSVGIIKGYPDGTFKPKANITRAEAVTMINRMMNRGPLSGISPTWQDVELSYWAYGDIEEASTDHTYMIENGIEKWAGTTPQ